MINVLFAAPQTLMISVMVSACLKQRLRFDNYEMEFVYISSFGIIRAVGILKSRDCQNQYNNGHNEVLRLPYSQKCCHLPLSSHINAKIMH